MVGFAAGDIPKLPLNLVLLKGCDVLGVFWGACIQETIPTGIRPTWLRSSPGRRRENSAHVHAVYPLEKTAEAIKSLSDRTVMGKVLLRP